MYMRIASLREGRYIDSEKNCWLLTAMLIARTGSRGTAFCYAVEHLSNPTPFNEAVNFPPWSVNDCDRLAIIGFRLIWQQQPVKLLQVQKKLMNFT